MDWKIIESAPSGRRILVWWPLVKILDNGDLAGEVIDGQVAVSVRTGNGWAMPGSYDADIASFGDIYEFADMPSHWAELPAGPPGSKPAWAYA